MNLKENLTKSNEIQRNPVKSSKISEIQFSSFEVKQQLRIGFCRQIASAIRSSLVKKRVRLQEQNFSKPPDLPHTLPYAFGVLCSENLACNMAGQNEHMLPHSYTHHIFGRKNHVGVWPGAVASMCSL